MQPGDALEIRYPPDDPTAAADALGIQTDELSLRCRLVAAGSTDIDIDIGRCGKLAHDLRALALPGSTRHAAVNDLD